MADSGTSRNPGQTRGSRRRPLLLAVGAVVVLAVLAAGLGRAFFAPQATPPPDSATLLHRAASFLQASRSFQFRYDVNYGSTLPTGSGLIIQSAHGEFVRPSSLSASIALLTQQGAVSSQIVEVGGKTYLLNPLTNAWGRVQGGFDPSTLFDPSRGIKLLLSKLKEIGPAVPVTLDGRPVWHIKATVPGPALALLVGLSPRVATVPVEIWIDTATQTIAQVKATGALSRDEPTATSRLLTLSGYGKTYSITPPAVRP